MSRNARDTTARLLITCDDRPGIVATVTGFLYNHGVNITALDQHSTDPSGGTFFLRLEFQTPHLDVSRSALERGFSEVVAARFGMRWHISYASDLKRMAILVSKTDHGLLELLWRWRRGELPAQVTMVISNHGTLRGAVEDFGVPFHEVPINPDDRLAGERRMLELLAEQTDLVVLARYMQILGEDFVAHYPQRIINIHHSFLPAFAGADPYKQADERGVKLIGATAHYATAALDAGPIIEQDVIRVSHRHSVGELRRLGRDIERQVLARAVAWHLEDRIIVHGNKTVVFV
ncbi:MAG: formyltetrahydrofolate deformylase [Proteobacteria bacterium]|nr:formyltetrahydrofolate deformylase [Pseudomonadota bacterium]